MESKTASYGFYAAVLGLITAVITLYTAIINLPDITVTRDEMGSLTTITHIHVWVSPSRPIVVVDNHNPTRCTVVVQAADTHAELERWPIEPGGKTKLRLQIRGTVRLFCSEQPDISIELIIGDNSVRVDTVPTPTPTPSSTAIAPPSETPTPTISPSATSTPTDTPTATITVTSTPLPYVTERDIDSSGGWVDSDIELMPNASVAIDYVGGTWTINRNDVQAYYVDADGYDFVDQVWYDTCAICCGRIGSLLARIGDDFPIEVRRQATIAAGDGGGRLYLSINDRESCNLDNDGSVKVRISVEAAACVCP